MEIGIEWEGVSGLIKIIMLFSVIFISGFIIGRKIKH